MLEHEAENGWKRAEEGLSRKLKVELDEDHWRFLEEMIRELSNDVVLVINKNDKRQLDNSNDFPSIFTSELISIRGTEPPNVLSHDIQHGNLKGLHIKKLASANRILRDLLSYFEKKNSGEKSLSAFGLGYALVAQNYAACLTHHYLRQKIKPRSNLDHEAGKPTISTMVSTMTRFVNKQRRNVGNQIIYTEECDFVTKIKERRDIFIKSIESAFESSDKDDFRCYQSVDLENTLVDKKMVELNTTIESKLDVFLSEKNISQLSKKYLLVKNAFTEYKRHRTLFINNRIKQEDFLAATYSNLLEAYYFCIVSKLPGHSEETHEQMLRELMARVYRMLEPTLEAAFIKIQQQNPDLGYYAKSENIEKPQPRPRPESSIVLSNEECSDDRLQASCDEDSLFSGSDSDDDGASGIELNEYSKQSPSFFSDGNESADERSEDDTLPGPISLPL